MSRSFDEFEELGRLTAALCDGHLTPDQAVRLEQLAGHSSEAREFFLHYLELHGELYWETGASARGRDTVCAVEATPAAQRPDARAVESGQATRPAEKPPKRKRRWIAPVATAAAVLLAALSSVILLRAWRAGPEEPFEPTVVAQVEATHNAVWSQGGQMLDGEGLAIGRTLALDEGLAKIRFGDEAHVILEGRAEFELVGPKEGRLHMGSLVANSAGDLDGLTIGTPDATVVDLGTEFGVTFDEYTEVHVFDGAVEIRPNSGPTGTAARHRLEAGEAVYVCSPSNGGAPEIGRARFDSARFKRQLPLSGTVAALRALVAEHPRLIHHYTFEGETRREKYRDSRGGLHLTRAVMLEGSGDGDLEYRCRGFDESTNAIRPWRASRKGNTSGVALQTEDAFHPPPALTVELLLSFEGFGDPVQGRFGAAVATRQSEDRCGFFVVAAEEGHLVHSIDASAPWIESQRESVPQQWYSMAGAFRVLVPGDWYYVAGTFQTEGKQTVVNTYAANLSRGEPTLHQLVRDHVAAGAPAAGRLGIGMGIDERMVNAYPWAGSLDEIAIYDAVLDRKTLEEHLSTLVPRGE